MTLTVQKPGGLTSFGQRAEVNHQDHMGDYWRVKVKATQVWKAPLSADGSYMVVTCHSEHRLLPGIKKGHLRAEGHSPQQPCAGWLLTACILHS